MKNLVKSLISFQSSVRSIPKNREVKNNNGVIKYRYADLECVWDAIRKPLGDNELAVIQCIVSNEIGLHGVKTILSHSTGEMIESVIYASEVYIPKTNSGFATMTPIQSIGNDLTYLRRYSLLGILGLTSDDDADGAWIAENNFAEQAKDIYERACNFKEQDDFTQLKIELSEKYNGKIPQQILNAMLDAHKEFKKTQKLEQAEVTNEN